MDASNDSLTETLRLLRQDVQALTSSIQGMRTQPAAAPKKEEESGIRQLLRANGAGALVDFWDKHIAEPPEKPHAPPPLPGTPERPGPPPLNLETRTPDPLETHFASQVSAAASPWQAPTPAAQPQQETPAAPPRRDTIVETERAGPPPVDRDSLIPVPPTTPRPSDTIVQAEAYQPPAPVNPGYGSVDVGWTPPVSHAQSPGPAQVAPSSFAGSPSPAVSATPGAPGAISASGDEREWTEAVDEFRDVLREMKEFFRGGKGEQKPGPQADGSFKPGGPTPGGAFSAYAPGERTMPRASSGAAAPWAGAVMRTLIGGA